jgi:hypothetical protein
MLHCAIGNFSCCACTASYSVIAIVLWAYYGWVGHRLTTPIVTTFKICTVLATEKMGF